MSRKIYLTSFVLLLIIFNLLLIIRIFNLSKKIPLHNSEHSSVDFRISEKIDDGNLLSNNVIIMNSLNNIPIILNEVLIDGPKLVLRYTEKDCPPCIDEILNTCKIYLEKNSIFKKNFIVISSFTETRQFTLLHKSRNFNFPIFNIQTQQLDLKIDSINIPYLFLLNKNLTVNSIYISEYGNNELLIKYLNVMMIKINNINR